MPSKNMARVVVCYLVLQLSSFELNGSSTAAQAPVDSSIIQIRPNTHEWTSGYLQWTHQHPGVIKRDASGAPISLVLEMPYLDLFGPDGTRLYHGKTSLENASLIDKLPTQLSAMKPISDSTPRPTLDECLTMFDALKPQRELLKKTPRYTLFSVSCEDDRNCRAQNDALRRIKPSASLRIIEVLLVSQ